MAGTGPSHSPPGQKPVSPAAALTADMDLDRHPAHISKPSTQQTFSRGNTSFEESGDENGQLEVGDGFERDSEDTPANSARNSRRLKAAANKRLETDNEMDLDGRIDTMTNHDHVSPVMGNDPDFDTDLSTDSNSYDSEESVDAYELMDEDCEDKSQTPVRHLKKPGHQPDTAATRKRASTSATTSTGRNTPAAASSGAATTGSRRAAAFAKGGRAVGTTLDEVDTLIFSMKAAGHGDKAISTLLGERGLARYDPKTISTRYRRIREARMAETDAALRTRRQRWSAEEDAALMDAHLHALRRQDEEMARLRKRLFKDVAFRVAETLPGAFYSALACERRYAELSSGMAVTERDLRDPEVERAEGKRRLTAVWEADVKRVRRETREWEDGVQRELAEGERERMRQKRVERGGTVKEAAARRGPLKRGRPKGPRSKMAAKASE